MDNFDLVIETMIKKYGVKGALASCLSFLCTDIEHPLYEDSYKDIVIAIRNVYKRYGYEV